MTSGAPWSVKGIDPKAREVAKDLARRSGMTLGEWLNHMILEDESPEDVFSESQIASRPARNYYETPRDRESAPPRYEAVEHPGDELTRVVRALERLTERIETSETHTGLAIGGVEHSVREAVARIEAAERDHVAVAARFEGAVAEVADAQGRLGERLRRVEAEAAGPRSAEALRSLEQALGKVAGHLYDGESRTRAIIEGVEARLARVEGADFQTALDPAKLIDAVVEQVGERLAQAETRTAAALDGLRDSFSALDRRLDLVEREGGEGGAQKFEQLAANLTARVEASRVEIAEKLRAVADGRFDRIEKTLSEVADQVRVGEQGSAQAIERIGREVTAMAGAFNQRVAAVESRSAEAIEQVGGEMARIAQAMEDRLGRTDAAHSQALERLGGEIARITERLAERIGASERRSAQAIDDVIEQVARGNERASQRQERASDDLAERIRQSEERTARLLDEARAKIEQGLADSQRRVSEAATQVAASSGEGVARLAPDPFADLGPAEPDLASTDLEPRKGADAFSAYAAFARPVFEPARAEAPFPAAAPPTFDADDFAAVDEFIETEQHDAPFPDLPESGEAATEPAQAGFAPIEPEPPAAAAAEALPEVEALNSALDILQAVKARQAERDVAAEAAQAGAKTEPDETSTPQAELRAPAFRWTAEGQGEAPAGAPAEPVGEAPSSVAPTPGEAEWATEFQSRDGDPFEGLRESEAAAEHESSFDIATPTPDAETGPAPEPARPLTTREVVEQARAAARAAAQNGDGKRSKLKIEKPDRGGSRGLFSGLGRPPKRRAGSKLQVALMLTGGAAALSVATAGFVLDGEPKGDPSSRVAESLALNQDDPASAGRAAVALGPAPAADALSSTTADPSQDLAGLYARALAALDGGQAGAAGDLRKVAELGYPRAQFHLAKLYENGEGGLSQDLVEARRWTERAARGGDREAMHNFALQQFFGDGGKKDPVGAAEWFRRAADLGLVDSQFNLARLYEDGVGAPRNLAEAYKWYLIAARSGDADSKASAARVRTKLSSDAQNVTERAALTFRSALPSAVGGQGQAVAADADAASVVTAQRALSRLGYYQGPTDGASSPALRMAISAYQRDQGLEASGALDGATVSRLSVFTR